MPRQLGLLGQHFNIGPKTGSSWSLIDDAPSTTCTYNMGLGNTPVFAPVAGGEANTPATTGYFLGKGAANRAS